MIRRLAALILLSTLSQTTEVPHRIPLTVAELGDTLTLTCPVTGDQTMLFYWYKLRFGYMVQTLAAGAHHKVSLQGQFVNSRFTVEKVNHLYFLNITNVTKEDEATYFCQAGAAYTMTVLNGTVLAVNDHKNQRKPVYVKQRPETESVRPGNTMTLECSLLSKNKENADQCPGEHSVYWFKARSGESHPSIIYTHGRGTEEEEERSCIYSLSKTIQDSSDTGTYYCAVDICGTILFGEGTEVGIRNELCPLVYVLGTLLGGCVIVIVALIVITKPFHVHCKGEGAPNHLQLGRSSEDQPNDVGGEAVALNYVALDFPSRRRERCMRELPQHSTYSDIGNYE